MPIYFTVQKNVISLYVLVKIIYILVLHTLVNLNEQKNLNIKEMKNLFVAIIRYTSLEIGELNWF